MATPQVRISRDIKTQLLQALSQESDLFGRDGVLNFMGNVLPLRSLPSEDTRYQDAYGDLRQHMVNNNDWEVEQMLFDRFKLHTGPEEYFIKLLETAVSPEIRNTRSRIDYYKNLINRYLVLENLAFRRTKFFEGLPVYEVRASSEQDVVADEIARNNIPFFKSSESDRTYPCFVLEESSEYDHSYKTTVKIKYYKTASDIVALSDVKILKDGAYDTWPELPNNFYELNENFCSIGTDPSYYGDIKTLFPEEYLQILLALKDAAMFPAISERFEKSDGFRQSLIRNNHAEENWRKVRFNMYGSDVSEAFKFTYSFLPPYATETVNLDFHFDYGHALEHRIYALIGKNGTGKTRILSGIASALSNDNSSLIGPKKPLYGKIFSISYSYFDKFEIPQGHATFNYVYCGLRKEPGVLFTQDELITRLEKSAERIANEGRAPDWRAVLSNFISQDVLELMFDQSMVEEHVRLGEPFRQAHDRLSSGQHILLYVLTELIAQIRTNSLILFDEPETHLHPNAITELMNSLLDLVKRYDSFCIIATHSPIVIQSLQSRDVLVVVREGNEISVRNLEKESFGENLTVITEDIFGTREVEKNYLNILEKLVSEGKSYEDILSDMERHNGLAANLNVRLYLKNLFNGRE